MLFLKQKETNNKGFKLKRKPWAFLLSVLIFTILAGLFTPNFHTSNAQQAQTNQSGTTNVGKWYTNQSITLRTETDVAGSDGVWKENANFVRIGNESNSGFKVRLRIYLQSPQQLTFAPNNWIGNPQRDSIRGMNRNLGFTDNFYGLIGYGGFVAGEGNSYCHEINIAKFVWNEGSLIKICEQKKGNNPWQGYSRADFVQLKDPVSGQTRAVVKSGELLGKIEFSFKNSELQSTGMDKPGIYKVDSWPHLIINTGDTGIIEQAVVGFIETQAMIQGAKVVSGVGSFSLSLAEKIKKGITSLPDAISQVKAKLLANGATAAEAEHLAEGMVKGSQALYDAYGNKLTQEAVEKGASLVVEGAVGKGSRAIDLIAAAAQETVGSAVANGGSQAAGAVEPALQTTAQVVESKLAASGVERTAAKTAAQGAFKTVLKNGLKFVSLAGWVYTFTEIGLYATSFTNEQVPWYTTNKHLLGVQVYDTEKEAQDHKGDPQPNDVPPPETKTGAGQAIGGTGSPLLGFLNQLINAIVGLLQELIYLIFYYFIAPIIQAMLNIRTYTDVFAAVIYPGWEVVRNVCNILFIVALIAIGLGTLFRVESYQYKHLLVDLIIAALLVNFSLVIAQAVLGVADTVQSQFLPNNVEVIRSLARDLMAGWKNLTWDFAGTGYFSNTIQPLFALALSIGSFIVFSALAGFLVVRIVMLWVLLMLSPLAYAMRVLPSTKSYAAKWWGEFLKYAFFTPIIAFFLNMAAVINNQYNAAFNSNGSVLQKLIDDPSLVGNSSLAAFVFRVGSNVIILVFLVIAIKAAEQAGVFGADVVAKAAKGGMMAPLAGTKFLASAGGNKIKKEYDKFTAGWSTAGGWRQQAFKAAHPVAFISSLREESKKERELYKGRVAAGATEVARKQFGWRRKTESPMYIFDEHEGKRLYEEEEGEWSDNEQIAIGVGSRLARDAKNGDLRAQIKLKHWLKEAFKHRNLNEALEGDNYFTQELLGGKLNYNSNNIRYFFQKLTDEKVLDSNFTAEFLKQLSKEGYSGGDYNGVELVYNAEDGHPHMIKMDKPVNGNALPVGWNTYVKERQRMINEADAEGRAEALRLNIKDEEQVGVMIGNILGKKEAEFAKHDHDYENSMHAERARMFMKINMSKQTGTKQVGMFHDSLVNINVATGKAEISDAGSEVLGHMDAGKMYAMGRDNMPEKTRDKFMRFAQGVMKDERDGLDTIQRSLEQIVTDRYRERGVKFDKNNANDRARLAKDVNEQRNLWLAASYSILSSKPGAGVMADYFEKVSEATALAFQANQKGLLNAKGASYSAEDILTMEPKALTSFKTVDLKGAPDLTKVEREATAKEAAEITKNMLIKGIKNFEN